MATRLQRKLAEEIVLEVKKTRTGKKPRSGGKLLTDVGYGVGTATGHISETLERDGVKEALKDLGFSLEAADAVVTGILHHGKEENRLKASDQIYKRLGGYAAEKHINLNKNVEVEPSDRIKELARKLKEGNA